MNRIKKFEDFDINEKISDESLEMSSKSLDEFKKYPEGFIYRYIEDENNIMRLSSIIGNAINEILKNDLVDIDESDVKKFYKELGKKIQ